MLFRSHGAPTLQALDWDIVDLIGVHVSDLNLVDISQNLTTEIVLVSGVVDVDRVHVVWWVLLLTGGHLALETGFEVAELSPLLPKDVVDDAGLVEPDTASGRVGALDQWLIRLVVLVALAVTLLSPVWRK